MTKFRRYEEAFAAYSRAVELDPGDAMIRGNLASALRSLGRYADSLIAADQAIALDPDNSTLHANRAATLRTLDRRDEALAAHERAIELDPGNSVLHSAYGLVLFASGQTGGSFHQLDLAIELEPAIGKLYEAKGVVLAITGDLDGALLLFESARQAEQNSNLGEGTTWAGAIFWHRHDPVAAQKLFSEVNANITDTPFDTAELEAIAYCGLGLPEKGEQRLRDAAPLRAPGDGEWREKLYELMSDPPAPGIDRLLAIKGRRK